MSQRWDAHAYARTASFVSELGAPLVDLLAPEPHERVLDLGFEVGQVALVPRPTPLPAGMRAWLTTFANPFLAGLDDAARDAVLAEAVALLEPALMDDQGPWTADYVRLRFAATRR